MSSPKGITLVAAVGVALVGIVLYARSGQSPPAAPERFAAGESAVHPGDQVEQRLQQLHRSRDASGQSAGGKIEARSGVAPDPSRMHLPYDAPGDGEGADAEGDDLDPDNIPALKRIALTDTDAERRLTAITILSSSDDPEVLPTLAQALSDADDEVRMAAIQGLADFEGDAPVDLLAKVAAEDPSPDNRYEALEILSDIGSERALAVIHRALNDSDEDVRDLAESILDLEDLYEGSSDAGDAPAGQP